MQDKAKESESKLQDLSKEVEALRAENDTLRAHHRALKLASMAPKRNGAARSGQVRDCAHLRAHVPC